MRGWRVTWASSKDVEVFLLAEDNFRGMTFGVESPPRGFFNPASMKSTEEVSTKDTEEASIKSSEDASTNTTSEAPPKPTESGEATATRPDNHKNKYVSLQISQQPRSDTPPRKPSLTDLSDPDLCDLMTIPLSPLSPQGAKTHSLEASNIDADEWLVLVDDANDELDYKEAKQEVPRGERGYVYKTEDSTKPEKKQSWFW